MNRCIYADRLAMLKTGNAIAAATMPAATLPILCRTTGTAMNTRRSTVNAMVMAAMTEMIAMTEGIETDVMTEMTAVKTVAMVTATARVETVKEEIN
jgi:hypothetical protein